jgi:hypothetical protein
MATDGIFNTGSWNSGSFNWYYEVYWRVNAYDQANNRTQIAWDTHLRTNASSGHWTSCSLAISVNGEYHDLGSGTWYKDTDCGSGTTWIGHDSDGNKAFGISASGAVYGHGVSGSGTWSLPKYARYVNVSQSFNSKTETTISMLYSVDAGIDYCQYSIDGGASFINATGDPYTISGLSANTTYNIVTKVKRTDSQLWSQTSSLAVTTYAYPYPSNCQSFTIGDQFTVTIANPLSRSISFSWYANGTLIDTYSINSQAAVINSSLYLDKLYATIPNSSSAHYTARVVYGSVTNDNGDGIYYANSSTKPVINSISYIDTNSNVTHVISDNTHIVQNLSLPKYTVTATANNSATLKSATVKVLNNTYDMSLSGSAFTVTGGMIDSSSNVTATATVVDSRGFSSSKTFTITMLPYARPTITLDGDRVQPTTGEVELSAKGKYYSGTIDTIANTWTTKTTWVEVEDTSVTGTDTATLTPTYGSNSTYTISNTQLASTYDYQKTFDFTVTLTDLFITVSSTKRVVVGVPEWHYGKNHFDVHGKLYGRPSAVPNTTSYTLDGGTGNATFNNVALSYLNGKTLLNYFHPVGSWYLSNDSTSPASLFGGTWEQLKDRFLVGAGNLYAVGTTGGEATVTLSESQIPINSMWGSDKTIGGKTASVVSAVNSGSFYGFNTSYGTTVSAHNNIPPYFATYMWRRTA